MRGTVFLRSVVLGALMGGCGDDPVSSFTPEDAAKDSVADASDDLVTDFDVPQFDIPKRPDLPPPPPDLTPPADTNPSPPDRTSPADTNPSPPDRTNPADTSTPGMCPASCRSDSDCNPCATPGDPGNYCCISGLCLYMTGACAMPAPDGGTGGSDGGDGGPDDSGSGGDTGGGG